MSNHRRRRQGVAVAALLLGFLGACGFPTENSPSPIAAEERPDGLSPTGTDLFAATDEVTVWFILDELLVGVDEVIRDVVAADLDERLAVDKPPKRTRPTGDGYDEILSRFHNPFELADVVRSQGYSDIRFHWYNYHPAYPMLANRIDPVQYRRAQVALEHEGTWRGMFLCSAGVIEATKDSQ